MRIRFCSKTIKNFLCKFQDMHDKFKYGYHELAALAQMVACLSLVQQDRGSIIGGVVNFHLKIFNL